MPGSDPGLLASLGDVPSELQNLGSEIFQNTSQVDGSSPLVGLAVGQRVVAWLVKCQNSQQRDSDGLSYLSSGIASS